jgi:RimJ/RimL family protein N-acetyltransferase
MKYPLPYIDSQSIVDAIGDEETVRFMDAVPAMIYTRQDAERFIEFLKYAEDSDELLELGLFEKQTGKFIGMCALENINRDDKVCELGYWLNLDYVGKGYMTQCVKTIIEYARETLHMTSINAFVITDHMKSIALLERNGFVRKELLENDTENKGIEVNRYWYKLAM